MNNAKTTPLFGMKLSIKFVALLVTCGLLIACDVSSHPFKDTPLTSEQGDNAGIVETGMKVPHDELCHDSGSGAKNTECKDNLSTPERVASRSNPDSVLSLFAVRPLGAKYYQYDDEIELLIKSTKDLYIYCYFQTFDGTIYQIFPNQFQPQNRISAGKVRDIPGDNRVTLVADSASQDEKVICYGHMPVDGSDAASSLSLLSLEKLSYQSFGEALVEHRTLNPKVTTSQILVITREKQTGQYLSRWESAEPVVVTVQANSVAQPSAVMQSNWLHANPFTLTANTRSLIGLVAAVVGVMAFLPYMRDVIRRVTMPHRASWFIWSVLSSISLACQFFEGAGSSLIFMIGQVGITVTIFILSLFFGTGRLLYRSDYILLTISAFGLVLWYLTNSPVYALLISIGISMLGGMATALKSYKEPYTETLSTWVTALIASSLAIVSVGTLDWILLAYPLYLFILYSLIVIAIIIGRRKNTPHRADRGMWNPMNTSDGGRRSPCINQRQISSIYN